MEAPVVIGYISLPSSKPLKNHNNDMDCDCCGDSMHVDDAIKTISLNSGICDRVQYICMSCICEYK